MFTVVPMLVYGLQVLEMQRLKDHLDSFFQELRGVLMFVGIACLADVTARALEDSGGGHWI